MVLQILVVMKPAIRLRGVMTTRVQFAPLALAAASLLTLHDDRGMAEGEGASWLKQATPPCP
jgi:hypothetical protein